MKTSSVPRLCYLLSHYISHRRAGIAYRNCIESLGVELVEHPREADIVILHNEPWSYPGYFRALPELRDRYVIAYSVWETDQPPAHYRHNLALVDEVWTCSSYCREALAPFCRRVEVIPHVVNPPRVDPQAIARMKQRIGYQDSAFYFYSITNGHNPRKDLRAALAAFGDLFPEGAARFIVKSHAPLPRDLPRPSGLIEIAEPLSDADLDALHHIAHCFVSTHHAEGWGLGLSEAMACGNLAVATGYSGNMEFMDSNNSLPVDYKVTPISEEDLRRQPELLTAQMRWAQIDQDDLRRKLRQSHDSWSELRPLRHQAQIDLRGYLPERIALFIDRRLTDVLLHCFRQRQSA